MPLHYLDTSALIKGYLPELGSTWMTQFLQTQPVACSRLALVEVAAALARRRAEGGLTTAQAATIWQRLQADRPRLLWLRLSERVMTEAERLLSQRPITLRLRTLDALHLASARLLLATPRPGIIAGALISADRALLDAATWAGLQTLNPEVEEAAGRLP